MIEAVEIRSDAPPIIDYLNRISGQGKEVNVFVEDCDFEQVKQTIESHGIKFLLTEGPIPEDYGTDPYLIMFGMKAADRSLKCHKVGHMGVESITSNFLGRNEAGMEIYSYTVNFDDGTEAEIRDTHAIFAD